MSTIYVAPSDEIYAEELNALLARLNFAVNLFSDIKVTELYKLRYWSGLTLREFDGLLREAQSFPSHINTLLLVDTLEHTRKLLYDYLCVISPIKDSTPHGFYLCAVQLQAVTALVQDAIDNSGLLNAVYLPAPADEVEDAPEH